MSGLPLILDPQPEPPPPTQTFLRLSLTKLAELLSPHGIVSASPPHSSYSCDKLTDLPTVLSPPPGIPAVKPQQAGGASCSGSRSNCGGRRGRNGTQRLRAGMFGVNISV